MKKSVLSESYNDDLQSSIPPTFEDKTKYTSKKQTDHDRQTREENLTQINNLPQLPVESDSGSLYPATGHNQNNQQIASQDLYDNNKRMEQEIAELKALLLKSHETIARGRHENTEKMADARHNNNRDSHLSSIFDTSNHRENSSLQQARPPAARETVYVHNSGVFDRDTGLDDLDRKFHRFTKISKPRHILNYFVGEFERLNVTDDHVKYNIIVGKWVPEEVSQYYELVTPENRNFQSFKEFFEKRDQLLPPILGKIPVHSSTTPFSDYVAEATKWAMAHENDRTKFFMYYHAPNALKSRIEEYFVEDLTQFKRRVQAIWSHQSDNPVTNPPVNYDRLRKRQGHQRHNRRRNNSHDDYSNQYQGNSVNFDHNSLDRDQNYSNSFGNYENNYDNRRQNFNDGHNNHHNVAHAGETPSRQTNNANNISRQGNFSPPSH